MEYILYNKTLNVKGDVMLPTEQQIESWEYTKGKRPFNGIGNLFRQYSQYQLMQSWEEKYHFKTALEFPFDRATDGIDGNCLSCAHIAIENYKDVNTNTQAELVWNFGFLQRQPELLEIMKSASTKYVAAFVPNFFNPGTVVHAIYHKVYKDTNPCNHPERGDWNLMNLQGLHKLFTLTGFKTLELGYADIPPFPDTVVTIKEFFGSKSREVLKVPGNMRKLLWFEKVAWPKTFWAHHCYILGEK